MPISLPEVTMQAQRFAAQIITKVKGQQAVCFTIMNLQDVEPLLTMYWPTNNWFTSSSFGPLCFFFFFFFFFFQHTLCELNIYIFRQIEHYITIIITSLTSYHSFKTLNIFLTDLSAFFKSNTSQMEWAFMHLQEIKKKADLRRVITTTTFKWHE